jgi:hypothetical protein
MRHNIAVLALLPLSALLSALPGAPETAWVQDGAPVSIESIEAAVRAAPRDPLPRFALATAHFQNADARLPDPLALPPPPLLPGASRDESAKKEAYASGERRLAVQRYREFLDLLGKDRERFVLQRWATLKNLLTLFTVDPQLPLREGRRYAETAEKEFPENAVMLMAAGRFFTARGHGADAERLLRRAVEELTTIETCQTLAAAYVAPIWPDRPQSDRAIAAIEACAARNAAFLTAVARVALACAYWDTASDSAARDEIADRGLTAVQAALALSPEDRDALGTAGLLYRIKASLAPSRRRLEYLERATELEKRARGGGPVAGWPSSRKP